MSQFKKYHTSVNLKFDNLDIPQSLKIRNLMGKNSLNSSKAKFHTKYFGLLWVN